jgi:spermidine synthase
MLDQTKIEITKTANIPELIKLYKEGNWWVAGNDETDPQFIQKIVEGSFCFAIAIYEGEIVGMGRAISDGVSDSYIQDVVVMKKYRGQGIGVKIMDAIVEYLQNKNVRWIALIAEPGAVSFYERYGFKIMDKYVPFLISD